ncbi:Coronin-like protein, partial [Phytophthora palmivora]
MAPRFAFRASKFRNVECKCLPREQSFDQLQVSSSPVDGNVVAATSSSFAFAHQMDNGGAIQVKALAQTGKEAPNTPPLVRAHPTGRVTALSFLPFHDDLLLSAGDANATVKLWKLPDAEPLTEDLVTLVTEFQQMGIVAGIVPHSSA